jgi:hypothetical protein
MLQEVSWVDDLGVSHREPVNGDPWEFILNIKGSEIIIYRNGKEIDWMENRKSTRNS